MIGNFIENKKEPVRVLFNHASILGVPVTPPSGDSSKYRSLYFYFCMDEFKLQ